MSTSNVRKPLNNGWPDGYLKKQQTRFEIEISFELENGSPISGEVNISVFLALRNSNDDQDLHGYIYFLVSELEIKADNF